MSKAIAQGVLGLQGGAPAVPAATGGGRCLRDVARP